MDSFLYTTFLEWHWALLVLVIGAAIALLGWAADRLVREAVALSLRTGMPKVVIGATVVSLGTTTPECAVSVFAALAGHPGLALGNAVGSIICDSGLILGIAALIAPLRIDERLVGRQGWVQFGAGVLIIACSVPIGNPGSVFTEGGNLPQEAGFLFLGLLVVYLWLSTRWAREQRIGIPDEELERAEAMKTPLVLVAKLIGALILVVLASSVLIPAVRALAEKASVPESIVSATLVAFGTSLPELVTAVAASLKGHGEIGLGNVIGADILNVFFVAGAAAAVTSDGLLADPHFYELQFPAMILILLMLRIRFSRPTPIMRPFGALLSFSTSSISASASRSARVRIEGKMTPVGEQSHVELCGHPRVSRYEGRGDPLHQADRRRGGLLGSRHRHRRDGRTGFQSRHDARAGRRGGGHLARRAAQGR